MAVRRSPWDAYSTPFDAFTSDTTRRAYTRQCLELNPNPIPLEGQQPPMWQPLACPYFMGEHDSESGDKSDDDGDFEESPFARGRRYCHTLNQPQEVQAPSIHTRLYHLAADDLLLPLPEPDFTKPIYLYAHLTEDSAIPIRSDDFYAAEQDDGLR
jgi:hypothetical protein